jgi:DNA replication and repair protein RecF
VKVVALQAEGARNLRPFQLVPGPRFNVFAGDNGQGKTNLLEAVYVLATLRSFRTSRLADVIEREAPRARLGARVVKDGLERRYAVTIEPGHRTVTLDDKAPRPLARYFGAFNVVLFAPEDLHISRGAPAERRKFIDRGVFAWRPAYLELAQTYEKVLKNRNAVLRAAEGEVRRAAELLEVYDAQLAPLAVEIYRYRRDYIATLLQRFQDGFQAISRTGMWVGLSYARAAELDDVQHVIEGYRRDRARDVARGSTSLGPHRDDFVFRVVHEDIEAGNYASQGQLRAVVLAWKTAELELLHETHGDPPILLLDDVSSELDESRNQYLFEYLSSREMQCFITTTHARHVQLTRDRLDHEVRDGVISPVNQTG